MRDEASWVPSKFHLIDGTLHPSSDPNELGVASRLVGSLQAATYQRAIELYARGRLVDLGCGKVPLYGLYRSRTSSVTCIDWHGSMHASPHVDVEADLNEGIPLPDGCADTILCTDVLEHIKDPFRVWKELARVLAPSGVAVITVPFMYWLHEEPHDHFRYTRHRLAAFCREQRMEVLELTEYGGPLAVLLDIIGKNLPRFRETYMRAALWLYRSPLGQRIDERNRASFPIGYLLVARKS